MHYNTTHSLLVGFATICLCSTGQGGLVAAAALYSNVDLRSAGGDTAVHHSAPPPGEGVPCLTLPAPGGGEVMSVVFITMSHPWTSAVVLLVLEGKNGLVVCLPRNSFAKSCMEAFMISNVEKIAVVHHDCAQGFPP